MSSKKILLRSPVLTFSGYGVHSRQVAHWLFSRLKHDKDSQVFFDPLRWGDTQWILNGQDNPLIEKVIQRSVDVKNTDLSLQIQLPNEWDKSISKYNVGMSAIVEVDRCHPHWVICCNSMDRVIVPSTFCKEILKNSGPLSTQIDVVHEAYPELYDNPPQNPKRILDGISTKFNFLIVGQLTGNTPEIDRKNIFYTIKWLCEVFKDKKDVGIILKTNMGKNTKIDNMLTNQLMSQLINEVRPHEFPKLHLLHGELDDEEMYGIYTDPTVKAFISLTHGEGFGLPLLEAAACGLPIIATAWSGHMDFLSLGKFIRIEYELKEIHKDRVDGKIFIAGAKWAYPIEDDFKQKVKKFYQSSSTPREWAKDLSQKIHENFSLSAICHQYENTLKQVL